MTPELDELQEMIGTERVATLLGKFQQEIATFDDESCSIADARARAHRLISQAGMLGFHALSQAARAFEAAPAGQALGLGAILRDEAGKAAALAAAFAGLMTPVPAGRPQ